MDIRAEKFSHIDDDGSVRMVDVGAKAVTRRVAIAEGVVEVNEHTMDLLKKRALPKGDVLTCAKIAAILAAKRTSDIIPMCHPLALSLVDVTFRLDGCRIFVNCETHTDGKTGVEMEAIIGVQAACARPCSVTSSSAACAFFTKTAAAAVCSAPPTCLSTDFPACGPGLRRAGAGTPKPRP